MSLATSSARKQKKTRQNRVHKEFLYCRALTEHERRLRRTVNVVGGRQNVQPDDDLPDSNTIGNKMSGSDG